MNEHNPEHMNQAEFMELMKKIESANAGQERYAKRQYRMSLISSFASILVLVIVLACAATLMPKLMHTFEQIDTAMTDLNQITSELSESMPDMLEDLDALMQTSSDGITDAMDKISAIDFEALNEAILDLQAIVEPISRLFGR